MGGTFLPMVGTALFNFKEGVNDEERAPVIWVEVRVVN
jgi:hypothetical protein